MRINTWSFIKVVKGNLSGTYLSMHLKKGYMEINILKPLMA